jgi:hypothetical protein
VTVGAEGVHTLAYRSIDKAGNVEAEKSLSVKIDITAPIAYSQFDPASDKVLVYAGDTVSGAPSGVITPVSVKSDKWSRNDDDEDEDDRDECGEHTGKARKEFGAEVRTYLITDNAGNTLEFVMKVKTEGHEIKAVITSMKINGAVVKVVYNVQSFMWNDDKAGNTRILVQRMHVGTGKKHEMVIATYNVKKNETEIRESDPRPQKKVQKPGLVLLKMYITASGLDVKY